MCKLFVLYRSTTYITVFFRNNYIINVKINLKLTQFSNLEALNNPTQRDMPLKLINKSVIDDSKYQLFNF